MLHCKSYFILVWCLILQFSRLDSLGAVTEQTPEGCPQQCEQTSFNCLDKNLDTFPNIPPCLQKITELDLSYNQIKMLPRDALTELTKLEAVVLSNNIIQSIPDGWFRGLTQLNELQLQSNNLSNLQPGVFKGLELLNDRLILRCNRLTQITTGVFEHLERINILAIDKNSIETIDARSFNGMRELGNLHLQDNRIVRLVRGMFTGLDKLKRLDLRANRIEVIESGAFEGLGVLEELKLSSNRITTVSGIADIQRLTHLDIADNRIQTVDNQFLLNKLHGDFQISIRDNPLHCTCKMETLRIWYRQNEETTDGARCATPAEYLNMTLASLKEPLPACPAPTGGSEKSTFDDKGYAEGSLPSSSFVAIIPVAGLLVLALSVYFVVRWYTSNKQPMARKPTNNNNLEQQPEHRVDTVQPDGYEPDAYHTFLPQDDEYSSATPVVEPQPPSLNGHTFKLSMEDGNSDLPSAAPEYLSFEDVNDLRSNEDIHAPLSQTRLQPPMSQWRPVTRPAVPQRFFSGPC